MMEEHVTKYYAPKNFNFWYYFGALSLLVLVLQIVTGIFLTMNYKPDGELAAEAFMGYLLPWGQMSYWGAQVIISLFGAIPFGIGDAVTLWLKGDYIVSDATLNRFFALHVIAVPLVLVGLVVAHILALHEVGSNNPDGIEIKANKNADGIPKDGIPFHPYYTVKDLFGLLAYFLSYFLPSCFLRQRWVVTF
ncbi:UNVERIFIED_CONTAM: hypothetical protein GTU68_030778 [Idotea baltica]|nr:hypothetical protein [Idotea baltica]